MFLTFVKYILTCSKMFVIRCTDDAEGFLKAFGRAEDLCDAYRIYSKIFGNCRIGSKLSDDFQSTRNSEDVFDVVRNIYIYSEMFGI